MYIDPDKIRESCLPNWQELVPSDIYNNSLADKPAEAIKSIIKEFIWLPGGEADLDIVTAYLCIPSSLAMICPVLFLQGREGSGKSNLGFIASKLYNVTIFSSSSTFAAMRNELKKRKYKTIQVPRDWNYHGNDLIEVEANTLMTFDDIDPSLFRQHPDIYRMLKYGYDRATDTIEISSEKSGENLTFRCFCPKVLSSITTVHCYPEFKEFSRRVITIYTKKLEDFSEAERMSYAGKYLQDKHDYHWTGIEKLLPAFWDRIDTATRYISTRVEVQRALRKRTHSLNSAQATISIDLMTSGVLTGIWDNPDTALEAVGDYWQRMAVFRERLSSPIEQLFDEYLEKKVIDYQRLIANGSQKGSLEISLRELRGYLKLWSEYLTETPSWTDLNKLLIERGFLASPGKWTREL